MRVCTPIEFMEASHSERRKYVLAQIDATPELHNQRHWHSETPCGTAYCFAGWAMVLAGGHVDNTTVSAGARQLLGLADTIMFSGSLTRDDLAEMCAALDASPDTWPGGELEWIWLNRFQEACER